MSKTHNAGIVTAYGAAVRGGYTGTYEEFCAQQAQYAENARQMEQAVSDVRQIKTSVESAVSEAEGYANNANQSATNASNSATQASESASNANQSAESASQFANNASNSANNASQSAASAQTSATNASASEQNAQQSAEDAQDILESVQTEGDTQIGRIQAKGQKVLDSIPEDFTEVQKDITALNGSLGDVKADIDALDDKLNPYHATLETGAMAKGKDVANEASARTKGYIVAPTGTVVSAEKYNNKNYVIYFYLYDKNYNYLSDATLNLSNAKSITVPSGVTFIRFFVWVAPGLVDEVTEEFKTAFSACISVYSETGIQSNRQVINEIIADIEDIKVTNPVLEVGAMAGGKPTTSTQAVRFAEYYLTQPGDKIYISAYENKNWTANFYYYDEQLNYLSSAILSTANGTFVTVPANTRFVKFFAWAVSGLVESITDEFLQKFSKCISFTVNDYLVNRAIMENTERITAIEKTDAVPSYFNTQLQTVSNDVISHSGLAGKNGTSFIFITDLHWDRNYKASPILIKYLTENTPVNTVVMGGDYISQFETNKQSAVDVLLDCMNKFKNKADYVFPIFGNHDRNSNHNGSTDVYLSKAETFALINSWLYLGVKYGDYFDFFIDDEKSKTRYICLDTGAQFIDGGEIDNASLTWMQSAINELSADWHVIVFAHWLFSPTTWNQPLVNGVLTGAYTQSAQALFVILDTINADEAKANIEGVITGHEHCDYNDETSGGIPIVFTDTDSKDTMEYTATAGTVSEQCFDVITFDYSNKKIYCDRIGRGNSREISY